MKKFVVGFVAAFVAAMMCVCFVACGASALAGNTYSYVDIEVKVDGNVPDEYKDMVDMIINSFENNSNFENMTMMFNSDGTVVTKVSGEESEKAYYKQEGDKVYILESADEEIADDTEYFTISGDELIMSSEESNLGMTFKIKVTFKK